MSVIDGRPLWRAINSEKAGRTFRALVNRVATVKKT